MQPLPTIHELPVKMLSLPDTGLLRLKTVLKFIDVSESDWYNGVKSGRYPPSVKDGAKAFWLAEDIRALIERIKQGQ